VITMEPPFGSSRAGSVGRVAAHPTPSKLLPTVADIKLSPLAMRPLSCPGELCDVRVIFASDAAMSRSTLRLAVASGGVPAAPRLIFSSEPRVPVILS
jgi:hypothetical protein